MAGRIRDEDVVAVRERAQLADVVVESGVQLKSAGGGRLKGLCPFHDEKTPSFNVNPTVGYYMCFGCGESGDVISYVRKNGLLSFVEAVEHLAGRFGVELRYEQGSGAPRQQGSARTRLVEAHRRAVEFYAEQLGAAGAEQARDFLADPRVRPGRGGVVRPRLRPRRLGRPGQAPAGTGLLRRGARRLAGSRPRAGAARSTGSATGCVWPIRDVTGDADRLRRAQAVDRPQGRQPQVPQHPRDAALQEVARALRRRRRQEGDRQAPPGGGRRGLHRRHGLPPGRACRRRSRPAAPPSAATTSGCCAGC